METSLQSSSFCERGGLFRRIFGHLTEIIETSSMISLLYVEVPDSVHESRKRPNFFKGYGVTERIGRLWTTVLRTASGHPFFYGQNRFTFLETKSLRNVVFFRRSSFARNSCQLWKRERKNGINCFRATWYLRKYESSPSGLQKQDSLFFCLNCLFQILSREERFNNKFHSIGRYLRVVAFRDLRVYQVAWEPACTTTHFCAWTLDHKHVCCFVIALSTFAKLAA